MAAPSAAVRVGILSDIQYCDCEDGTDFSGEEKRYFRNSLVIAQDAVSAFNGAGVDAVATLGDVIDGKCRGLNITDVCLERVRTVLEQVTAPRYDLVGNHELYNFNRDALPCTGLKLMGEGNKSYYSATHGNWDLIFLDSFETCLIGYDEGDERLKAAEDLMRVNNPNVLATGTGVDWFEGLPVEKHRWVPFNGALSEEQVAWLRARLTASKAAGRHAVIFAHVALFAPASKPKTVLWNAEEVMALTHEFADTVVAVIAGHDHDGGYGVDAAGIHHVTVNAPLTATPGEPCWAILELFDGWGRLECFGKAVKASGGAAGGGKHYPELVLAKGAVNTPV